MGYCVCYPNSKRRQRRRGNYSIYACLFVSVYRIYSMFWRIATPSCRTYCTQKTHSVEDASSRLCFWAAALLSRLICRRRSSLAPSIINLVDSPYKTHTLRTDGETELAITTGEREGTANTNCGMLWKNTISFGTIKNLY